MKALLLTILTIASTQVYAGEPDVNPERLICDNRSGSTIVVIEQVKDLDPSEGSITATASMLIVKLDKKKLGDRIPLAGSKEESAKGPYYELGGPDGYSFFISAPASKSSSELTIGNRVIKLNCE